MIKPTRYGAPVARSLVAAIMAELSERYGGDGEGDQTPVEAVEFDPPEGLFLVAWRDGEPVGCGGWRTLSHFSEPGIPEDVAEIKRMYTAPAARKSGVAAALLAAIEESAREGGMRRVVLETGLPQPEAIALYEKAGYTRIPNYGHYRDDPLCVSYGRDL
ncbi:GNAT family N-acetyltransferase [Luedemannella helvata]|uniref:GNAT family N-acetyltransferase n=1 Tax=Luedemannella helvata TaxID=349315 RepID=A0ABP4WM86_9ACTN